MLTPFHLVLSPPASASGDYVLPHNAAWQPFVKSRTINLPDALFEEYNRECGAHLAGASRPDTVPSCNRAHAQSSNAVATWACSPRLSEHGSPSTTGCFCGTTRMGRQEQQPSCTGPAADILCFVFQLRLHFFRRDSGRHRWRSSRPPKTRYDHQTRVRGRSRHAHNSSFS